MTDKIDMSLDDIIKMQGVGRGKNRASGNKGFGAGGGARPNRENFGPLRNAGGNRGRSNARPAPYSRAPKTDKWQHDMFDAGGRQSAHLIVTNLDFGVTDADIEELFAEFGPLRKAEIRYDRSGRSVGVADVIYDRKSDAVKALKQYNGVPLDGREMKIKMATGEGPSAGGARASSRQASGNFRRATGATGGRGRGRGINRPGGRRPLGGGRLGGGPKKEVTAEELDADLDAYVNKATL